MVRQHIEGSNGRFSNPAFHNALRNVSTASKQTKWRTVIKSVSAKQLSQWYRTTNLPQLSIGCRRQSRLLYLRKRRPVGVHLQVGSHSLVGKDVKRPKVHPSTPSPQTITNRPAPRKQRRREMGQRTTDKRRRHVPLRI